MPSRNYRNNLTNTVDSNSIGSNNYFKTQNRDNSADEYQESTIYRYTKDRHHPYHSTVQLQPKVILPKRYSPNYEGNDRKMHIIDNSPQIDNKKVKPMN